MTQVVEFLRTANVDVERLRRQGPILATGWAATDVQGTEVFERYVYLSRQELDLAIAAFGALAGDLKPDLPGSLFRRSLDLVTCPDHPLYGFYGQTVTPEQGLDQYLAVSIGIPCGSNRILRYTKTQLRSMSERDRAVLREHLIGQVLPKLVAARNDQGLWQQPGQGPLDYAWLPEKTLIP